MLTCRTRPDPHRAGHPFHHIAQPHGLSGEQPGQAGPVPGLAAVSIRRRPVAVLTNADPRSRHGESVGAVRLSGIRAARVSARFAASRIRRPTNRRVPQRRVTRPLLSALRRRGALPSTWTSRSTPRTARQPCRRQPGQAYPVRPCLASCAGHRPGRAAPNAEGKFRRSCPIEMPSSRYDAVATLAVPPGCGVDQVRGW